MLGSFNIVFCFLLMLFAVGFYQNVRVLTIGVTSQNCVNFLLLVIEMFCMAFYD
jgi:hypothetical protein